MALKTVEKYRKHLAIIGVTTVLGSWIITPLIGHYIYDIAAIDTAFLLTIFWTGIWSLNVLRKKYV